jgi:NADPH-dependent glutamate synthase beta subunit-like oxidoreductase
MPTLTIDGRQVEVAAGRTVLDAARQLGLDIPTLCYLEQCGPMTSCLVCVVKVQFNGQSRVVPSCGLPAQTGMVVESETAEVRDLRRTALELLFSEHVGDCLSPCHRICPLDLNIPRMIRQIETAQPDQAIATVRRALALPGVLGRLCHAPCQNGCRRSGCDGAAAIRELERHAADTDRDQAVHFLPPRKPATGKRLAIVGAGPAGLAAADHLLRQGHGCTLFDRHGAAGGTLRRETDEQVLPREVLDFEVRQIENLGAEWRLNTELGVTVSLAELQSGFDAVLLAIGELAQSEAEKLGLPASPTGLQVNAATSQTALSKVFAAGSSVRPAKHVVRAMADGRDAAECIHQFLAGHPIRGSGKAFSSAMGRLDKGELELFLKGVGAAPRTPVSRGPSFGFTPEEARQEAGRCLHCDCRAAGSCALQQYAELYGANASRFARQRRPFTQQVHPANVLFEPGKCILCGICIEIARQAAEPLGLTFVGRGFDVQVAAPLNRPFADGLQKVAAECVTHCPTGAIVFNEQRSAG